MKIINSFKKETLYEFSEAIPITNDNVYIIFKVDIISIGESPSKANKLKGLMKSKKTSGNSIAHLDIEPIAYLLETKIEDETKEEYDYQIEAIDERYESFIEKNKKKLLEEFLER